MKLSDLYHKKYLSDNAKFYDKYKILENTNFPSAQKIANFQLKQIKEQFPIDNKMQSIIKSLNLDIITPIVDTDNMAVNEAIQSVENALGLWYQSLDPNSAAKIKTTISSDVLQGIKVDLDKYEKMLQNLQIVYNKLGSSEYSSNNFIKTRLDQIDMAMKQIALDIKQYREGVFIPKISVEENKGYLENAINLGYGLKGKYLEIAATNWFSKKLPHSIKVVNVGNITGYSLDIFGQKKSKGKELRTDIMGFDKAIAATIQITYTINGQEKTSSLLDLINQIEKNNGNDIISLNNTDYSQIKKALVFGAQAKSGINQSIFNKTSANIQSIVNANAQMQYAKALRALTQIASNSNSKIIKKSINYDAMFNYLLGKQIGFIIGKENNLVVTRNGVQTIYNYMKDQWNQSKKIVRAINKRIDIAAPNSTIDIGYGKAENV